MLNPILEPVVERRFYLQQDAYVAFGKDAAAILKLSADKYEGLDTGQTAALGLMVQGWPVFPDTHEIPENDAEQFADFLVGAGLLTRDRNAGKVARQVSMAHPKHALVTRQDREVPVICRHHRIHFAEALATGYYWWKRPLNKTIEHVQRSRPKTASANKGGDLDELRELVRVFYWIRPWVYEKRVTNPKKQTGLCLFDSLVMLEFLSEYGFYPTLVFGVMMRPFAAHSWVQEGEWILNGSMDFVAPYDCILTATRKED